MKSKLLQYSEIRITISILCFYWMLESSGQGLSYTTFCHIYKKQPETNKGTEAHRD